MQLTIFTISFIVDVSHCHNYASGITASFSINVFQYFAVTVCCPLKGQTYSNLELKVAGLLKYVSPFRRHQLLKVCKQTHGNPKNLTTSKFYGFH